MSSRLGTEPLGTGQIADILDRAIAYALTNRHASWTDGVMLDALEALSQLRRDTRALRAKQRLDGHERDLPWQDLSSDELAINEAVVILNWGAVPDWMSEYPKSLEKS